MSTDQRQDPAADRGAANNRRPSRRGGRRGGGRSKKDVVVPLVTPELLSGISVALEDGEFIVFDIETTGGNPEKNGITEVFAIRWKNGEILGTFYSLVNPGIPIPPIVRRMTGIDNKMVRSAPRIDQVMPDLVQFIGNGILVSHNTIGDMKFIRHFAKEVCQIDLGNFYMCTHLLVEKLASEAPDKSLKGLAEFFKLASGDLHRAEADAYVTLDLFKVLLGRLRARSVKKIEEAIRLQGDIESGMRLGWGVRSLGVMPSGPGVFSLYDHEQQLIFLSSALHVDREVAKLRSLNQLPRQLLRLVLRTYDLRAQQSANGFAAMLDECEALGNRTLPFPPAGWHQRLVQTFYIADDVDGLRLDIGPLEAKTRQAFGPVRDRRIAGEFLDAIGLIFGHKVGRRGLVLSADQGQMVVALLEGRLAAEYEEVGKKRRSLKLWFKPKERTDLSQRTQLMKALLALPVPKHLTPLLDRAGVMLAPLGEGKWQAHRIVGSLPTGLNELDGTIDSVLSQDKGKEALANLSRDVASAKAGEPLSVLDANRANAFLWWLYNGKAECRFVPVAQLNGAPSP